MDQLRQFVAQAIKHQFWILVAMSTLLGGVAWYMTNSQLQQLYTTQETVIKSKYSALDQVSGEASKHPNKSSQEEMERIMSSMTSDVQKAWDEQYKRQADYLKWPDINLERLFAKLDKYYPVEMKLTFPKEPRDIVDSDRDSFSKYFDRQLPELAKIIGVEWGSESSGAGSPASGSGHRVNGSMGGNASSVSGSSSSSNDIVRWPLTSQNDLLGSIRLWPAGTKPSVYEMLYTQENVWILQSLFNIIAKTNVDPKTGRPAAANVQAAVKEIEFIRIGSAAIGDAGDITTVAMSPQAGAGLEGGTMDAGGGMDGTGGMDGESGLSGDQSLDGSGASEPGAVPVRDPASRRYVDRDFNPIAGGDLREKINSEEPTDAYFAVAKRVPVRLRLLVDTLRIPQFLANCGNEGMMLEVRQVRIGDTTPAASGGGQSGGGMSSGFSGGRPSGIGMGKSGSSSSPSSSTMSPGSTANYSGMNQGQGKYSSEIMMEVYGVVYLFYPVNIDRLGLNKVDENTQLSDTVAETPSGDASAAGAPAAASTDASAPAAASLAPPEGQPAQPNNVPAQPAEPTVPETSQ